jgi:hypothetical protein
MTHIESMKAERRDLLAHIDSLNDEKRFLRTQIDLNSHHSDIKAEYDAKLARLIRASYHAEHRLRSLNDELKFANIERNKPKQVA